LAGASFVIKVDDLAGPKVDGKSIAITDLLKDDGLTIECRSLLSIHEDVIGRVFVIRPISQECGTVPL
jgi:hypothetical protein